jgi:tetratricopeptide (TPR) repeat protein
MGNKRESFEAVQKSTVRIKDAEGRTWGTGFFVNREGYLLTCAHVVRDAGGWENVRVLDQPVTCLYEGDPDRDDFSLLQVEDVVVVPVELGTDFDPGDEFLSFGFSNDDFYGAPIRGEITGFARCGKLGDQKLIRLETFSDAQRIEGGQSGAPVCVYKKGKYKVIGLIVASEDLNGGLVLPLSTVIKNVQLGQFINDDKKTLKILPLSIAIGILLGLVPIFIFSKNMFQTFSKCSNSEVARKSDNINNQMELGGNNDTALADAIKLNQECPNNETVLTTLGRAQVETKKYEEAIVTLTRKEIQNNNVEARYNLGVAYAEASEIGCEKALDVFQELQDIPKVKLRVYYNIGRCLYLLEERLPDALKRLDYVLNRKQENPKLFSYALYYLKEINAKLWYENNLNKNPSAETKFRTKFLHYYKIDFDEREPNDQLIRLQRINQRIFDINLAKEEPQYSFIYSTPEFRGLLCKLHQKVKLQVPDTLKKICQVNSQSL